MTREFEHFQDVHFGDVDLGGGLYHPRYLEYFDRARVALLSELGFPFHEMMRAGNALVVASANVAYKRPVGFGDKVRIVTRIGKVTNRSFSVSQTLWSDAASTGAPGSPPGGTGYDAECTTLEIALVHVDLNQRLSTPLPEGLARALRDAT